MNNMQFQVPRSVTFQLLHGASDVAIKGWDKDTVEFVIDGDPQECQVEQQEGILTVRCNTAFSASIPETAIVQIAEAAGDLVLRNLLGPVTVDSVAGDTLVQSLMGPLSINTTHGDLTTEEVNGPLNVQNIYGDARLRQHTAPVSVGAVYGDLRAKSIHGSLEAGSVSGDVRVHGATSTVMVEQGAGGFIGEELIGGMDVHVKGDVTLKTTLTPGMSYRARTEGDVSARIAGHVSARFVLSAQGSISAKLPQVETQEQGRVVGQVGAGEAQVELAAGGDLVLKLPEEGRDFESAFAGFESNLDFGQDIARQVETQIAQTLEGLDIDGLAQREIEKAMRRAEREIERAQEHAQRVQEQAQRVRQKVEERARHAQERAERAARRAQEKLARHPFHGYQPFGQEPQQGRRPQKRQVSEQEQLAVLKMVQDGKISIEEAEKLLRALEG